MDTTGSTNISAGYGAQRPVPRSPPAEREAAIELLFDRHRVRMVRVAAVLVGDAGLAEDVVQDAFISVHAAWDQIRDKDAAVAYLHRSVVNTARSRFRRRSIVGRLLALRQDVQTSAEDVVMRDRLPGPLAVAIAALPRREREAVLLRYYLDLSENETAEALGLRPGSIKAYSSRGLAKLRIAMEPKSNPEDQR